MVIMLCMLVGAMIRGIPVSNGQYSGGVFGWLAPFPILTGIGLVLGYALLGAGWLVLNSEGILRDWARRRIPWLAAAVLAVIFVAFTATTDLDPLALGNMHARPWGLMFAATGTLALIGLLVSFRSRRDGFPFAIGISCAGCNVLALHNSVQNHSWKRRSTGFLA